MTRRITRRTALAGLAVAAGLIGACAHEEGSERERESEAGREAELGSVPQYAGFMANLDFEAGEDSEGGEHEPAVAWKGGGPGFEFGLERQGTHSGKYSARLRSVRDDIPPPNNTGAIMQCADAAPFRGRRLKYTAWVRTRDVKGLCALYIRVDGPGLRPVYFENTSAHAIRATTEWTRYEVPVDFPADAVGYCFGLVLTGTGTAWLDDVKFERVEAPAK